MQKLLLPLLLIVMFFSQSCSKRSDGTTAPINVFSLSQDKQLGEQVAQQTISNPQNGQVLDSASYPKAYGHLYRIVNTILNSGKLDHRNDFNWKIWIIKNDTILNAFCAPGGKIFVYSALIKYLDKESDLAGVLGHEIAHADRRHVTNEMTKKYGIDLLLQVVLGQSPSQLVTIAEDLTFLKFSRDNESDADKMSVIYLCPTSYYADGAASFFKKLIAEGKGNNGNQFFSTHPSPDNRVTAITSQKATLGCTGTTDNASLYQDFKNSLPK